MSIRALHSTTRHSNAARRACGRFVLALAALAASAAPAGAASFEGDWNVPGDKPGEIAATVTLVRAGDGYHGIVKSFDVEPGEDPNPVCAKCPPPRRGLPIRGLEVIWGLRPEAGALVDGHLLDPVEGQVVRCRMNLSDDGERLVVTMYVGLPIFGGSEEWKRVTPARAASAR